MAEQAFDVVTGGELERHGAVGFAVDELLDFGVGVLRYFVGCPACNDGSRALATAEHDHLGADAESAGHVMRDNHGSHFELSGEVECELVNHRCHDGVEAGGGFVAEEQLGIERHGAGQSDAFSHASAELGRLEMFEACESYQLELHFHDEIHDVGIDTAVFDQRQRHILSDGQGLKQGAELEIHSEAEPELVEFLLRHSSRFLSEDLDRTACRSERADDVAQYRAFAATGASHDDHGVALFNGEADAVENGSVSEFAHEIANFNHGIFHFLYQ